MGSIVMHFILIYTTFAAMLVVAATAAAKEAMAPLAVKPRGYIASGDSAWRSPGSVQH